MNFYDCDNNVGCVLFPITNEGWENYLSLTSQFISLKNIDFKAIWHKT